MCKYVKKDKISIVLVGCVTSFQFLITPSGRCTVNFTEETTSMMNQIGQCVRVYLKFALSFNWKE